MEVPTCDTGFLHEKWPPFWGSSKLIFFENVSCNRPSWYNTYQLSGSHSVEALSPKKSICAQKAINFSIPTKIVVAARQSVKSQLHVGKQPTKNQAVKIGQPRTWPYQTPKRDVRATTKKTAKRVGHQSESSECLRRQLNLRISFKTKTWKDIWQRKCLDKTTIRRLDHCRKSENGLFSSKTKNQG